VASISHTETSRNVLDCSHPSLVVSQVTSFPAHFWGEPVALLTVYLHEVFQAVLIATAGSTEAAEGADSTQTAAAAAAREEDAAHAASRGSSALSAGSVTPSASSAHSLVLAPLHHVVTPHTSAFVIAADVRVVLDIMDAPAQEYATWKLAHSAAAAADAHVRAAQQHGNNAAAQQSAQLCGVSNMGNSSSPQCGTAVQSPVKEAAQLPSAEATADRIASSPQQQQQQPGSQSMSVLSVECSDVSAGSSVNASCMQSPGSRSQGEQAAAAAAGTGPGNAGCRSSHDGHLSIMSAVDSSVEQNPAAAAAAARPGRWKSRRTAGDVEAGSSRIGAAAALVSTSAKALLSIPASLASAPGSAAAAAAGPDSSAAAKRRHTTGSRGAIQVKPRQRDFGGTICTLSLLEFACQRRKNLCIVTAAVIVTDRSQATQWQ
jgi:hypothetical protein